MKKLVKNEKLCTACGACQRICSQTYFKEDNKEKSAIGIKAEDSGTTIIACSQCGECIDLCPAEAIYRDQKGVVRIKNSICVGCFSCVGFCPEGAMFYHGDYTEPFKCTACGLCVKECPSGAITIQG
ncbi:Fe-S-cluster-containing hydrogenase component 2 [Desulfohalotomaculum tongense]|uniref:4Fe-4S binding protein n=1 Tax=Desulforadius tongensis TaxID=1216062 RepID=UPI00195D8A80|nr:4Fe-4S dicluster domain-containing protein [Desulforadius tongensis]MBM7854743.1 Fe-S-cluster-containing hydrogenase component 2 [Desulforadius tongensis]